MTTTKLEDSNIANYGSKDHKDAKEKKARAEAQYVGAGQEVGVEVWRVGNFGVHKVDKKEHGQFYKGDCYIVLKTYKRQGENVMRYNAHFWLGADSTQDEQGTVAFKVVELDDLLGDMPVQYRECMGFESEEFLSCFKNVFLLDGGNESAFHKVKPTEYAPRLLHFKGSGKNVKCTQLPLARSSLNQGDVFLLDKGLTLIQWNGPTSGPMERRKAQEMIASIREDRNGRPSTRTIDNDADDEDFWPAVGGKGPIPDAIPDVKQAVTPASLHSVSDASGRLETKLIATGGALRMSLLNNDDCFILDNTATVYVWVGSNANVKERTGAMKTATDFLASSGRPASTPVIRLVAGGENASFRSLMNA